MFCGGGGGLDDESVGKYDGKAAESEMYQWVSIKVSIQIQWNSVTQGK